MSVKSWSALDASSLKPGEEEVRLTAELMRRADCLSFQGRHVSVVLFGAGLEAGEGAGAVLGRRGFISNGLPFRARHASRKLLQNRTLFHAGRR